MKQAKNDKQSGTVTVEINGETTENVDWFITTVEAIELVKFDWTGQLLSGQAVSHFKIELFGNLPPGTYDLKNGEVLVQYFTVISGQRGSTAAKTRRMAPITQGTFVLGDLTASHLKADLDFTFAGSATHTVRAHMDVERLPHIK
jgi:hypothetical protein